MCHSIIAIGFNQGLRDIILVLTHTKRHVSTIAQGLGGHHHLLPAQTCTATRIERGLHESAG
jgi:PP-loop superfamily ATP-utilizing enzyme